MNLSPINEVHLIAAIADMKDVDYSNTLAISSIIELLIEKGIVTRNEVARKAYQLDNGMPGIHDKKDSAVSCDLAVRK